MANQSSQGFDILEKVPEVECCISHRNKDVKRESPREFVTKNLGFFSPQTSNICILYSIKFLKHNNSFLQQPNPQESGIGSSLKGAD